MYTVGYTTLHSSSGVALACDFALGGPGTQAVRVVGNTM